MPEETRSEESEQPLTKEEEAENERLEAGEAAGEEPVGFYTLPGGLKIRYGPMSEEDEFEFYNRFSKNIVAMTSRSRPLDADGDPEGKK
jgi:hypothetical protein